MLTNKRDSASDPPLAVNVVTLLYSLAGLNLYMELEIHPPHSKKGHHVRSCDLFDGAEERLRASQILPCKPKSYDDEDSCPHEDTHPRGRAVSRRSRLAQANRTSTSVGIH